jgi:transcriptional regulator with XRE-family HTH domain
MSESFGARLRQRRDGEAISLTTIAEQTKIKLSLLEALERDDVSQWPAGIFRRAFIRAYAHAIGLNPDDVVREFLEVHPDPVEVVATTAAMASAAEGGRPGAGPPTRLRNIVGSAIGSLARLRRAPALEDPAPLGDSHPATALGLSDSYHPAVAHPPTEPDVPAPAEPAFEVARIDEPVRIAQPIDERTDVLPVSEAISEPRPHEPDLLAAAQLCTELGRVENAEDVQPLLQEAAKVMDAIGLIVWVWDPQPAELRPALASGYSDRVLAQLPTVKRDTDNATAAAFRSAQTCAISGSEHASGALAVPMLTPGGCAGVLAIELPNGREQARSVQALATIFAAQLAQLIGGAQSAEAQPRAEAALPIVGPFTPPILYANVRR